MKLEIDMPEHQYNNIIAFDSVSLGRVPYKGIIMYAINAIKRGKALDQEPTAKKDLEVDREDEVERLNALKQFIGYDKDSEIVKATQKSLDMAIKALEQEPRKGHWINKQHLFESCSAECSSCHKRSNGYVHDNGFSLEFKYFDFCPKCGSDNREVKE